MTKSEHRKQLEQGMTAFLSNGGKITKCDVVEQKKRRPKKEVQEETEYVEIEVDALPVALQKKFFPQEG